VGSVPGGNKIG
jgi:hypothetical protein